MQDPLSRASLFLLLTLLLSSCLGYKEVVLQEVKNIEVRSMDAKGVSILLEAVIENPNGYRIKAMDPDVDLFLNGKFIGKGHLDSTLVLEKRSTNTYSIPLHAELNGGSLLGMMLTGALSDGVELKATGTVVGKAGFLRKRFPFELTEQLDL
jgi:LEA14-like dessication related protein